MSDLCSCWAGPVSLHDGHCCFAPEALEGCHYKVGMAAWRAAGSRPVTISGFEGRSARQAVAS